MGERTDVLVVGAGFAGLYALHTLRRRGLSVRVIETGDGVGGTWFWNRYPGARCDVESHEYCYSFDPELVREWRWSRRYPAQPEIERYLNHVADRYDLVRDIAFGTRVSAATFDDAAGRWLVKTDREPSYDAKYLVLATGNLSVPRLPALPGIDEFGGQLVHPGRWSDDLDLGGKRVGVLGTGSTAVQIVPAIAARVERLYVFQRTAAFAVPAQDSPIDRAEQSSAVRPAPTGPPPKVTEVSADQRWAAYERAWASGGIPFVGTFADLLFDQEANDTAAEFVRAKIAATVSDPKVAARLSEQDYPLGAKRICIEDGYYEAFNRPNVTLVDLRAEPLVTLTGTGVRTEQADYDIDVLVSATGYDAFVGAARSIDIRGRGGRQLVQKLDADGPHAYLGLAYAGFPNMFVVTGAGSPSVLGNMVAAIEQHVDFIAGCLDHVEAAGARAIEVEPAAERAWSEHVSTTADRTLLMKARSWYIQRRSDGEPVCLPYPCGLGAFRCECDEVAAVGYRGFVLAR